MLVHKIFLIFAIFGFDIFSKGKGKTINGSFNQNLAQYANIDIKLFFLVCKNDHLFIK